MIFIFFVQSFKYSENGKVTLLWWTQISLPATKCCNSSIVSCDIHERHWIWMVINLEYFIVNAFQIPKQCPQNQTIYMLIPNWLCSAAACCTSLWWAAPPWPGSVRPSWGSQCCRPRWTPSRCSSSKLTQQQQKHNEYNAQYGYILPTSLATLLLAPTGALYAIVCQYRSSRQGR